MLRFNKNVLIALAAVLILWLIGFLMPIFFCSLERSGQFGDTFGSVSSLFNGLGFVALVYTILLQQQTHRAERIQDDVEFVYGNISNIISHFKEYEFSGKEGTAALDEFARYLQEDAPDNKLFRSTVELLNIVMMVESLEETLHSNMNVYSRDRFDALRSRFEFIKIKFVSRLKVADASIHVQQRVNNGGTAESVYIRVMELTSKNQRLLFPDELPPVV